MTDDKKYIKYALVDPPRPSVQWSVLPIEDKVREVNHCLAEFNMHSEYTVRFVELQGDTDVYVELIDSVFAEMRSKVLLSLEMKLKGVCDESLVVWLRPLGDKNSLRRLRGVLVRK
jgi:hypothetical protein